MNTTATIKLKDLKPLSKEGREHLALFLKAVGEKTIAYVENHLEDIYDGMLGNLKPGQKLTRAQAGSLFRNRHNNHAFEGLLSYIGNVCWDTEDGYVVDIDCDDGLLEDDENINH